MNHVNDRDFESFYRYVTNVVSGLPVSNINSKQIGSPVIFRKCFRLTNNNANEKSE